MAATVTKPPPEAVKGLSSALRVIQEPEFLRSEAHQAQHWRANRDGADARIRVFEKRFVARMAKLGVPMFCHCMVRTLADQRAAFVQGNSQNDGSRPYPHMAWAVDIVHGTMGWELPREAWQLLGHIGKEVAAQEGLKLVWGGDWKGLWDPAHWEVETWRDGVIVETDPRLG